MHYPSHYVLQNIVRCYKNQWLKKRLPLKHIKAIEALSDCRSGALGVSAYECECRYRHDDKHKLHLLGHSCRHRSCSVCSGRSRHHWIEQQQQRLLDCAHFHCVFSLPSEYHVLWQYNQRWFVSTFFEVVRSTLMDLMGDESKHGVKPGVLMAMHTWARQLTLHPHIHCVVTGGGVDVSGQWKPTGEYLLAAGQVRTLFRGRFQAMIKAALDSEELVLPPDQTSQEFQTLYKKAYTKRWCVRIEPQYAHGRGVLKYLSRYLRGGPIHASQIVRCDTDQIGFRYKDHRRKRTRLLSVKPEEFMRRLLLHVPEPGQHMVRHYGLYAGAARNSRNACRDQFCLLMEKLAAE